MPNSDPHSDGGRIPASKQTEEISVGEIDRSENEIALGSVRVPFSTDRQVAKIQYDDLCRGLCIAGATGRGKTTVATNILTQLAIDGRGFVYMDAKGTGTVDLLRSLPESRLDDVNIIGMHPNEYDNITGFDIRETPRGENMSDLVIKTLFEKISGETLDEDVIHSINASFDVADRLDMPLSDLQQILNMDEDDLVNEGLEIDDYVQKYVVERSATDSEIESVFSSQPLSGNPILDDIFDPHGHSIYNSIITGEIIILCIDTLPREMKEIVGTALFGKLTQALIDGGMNPDTFYPVVVDDFTRFGLPAEIIEKYVAKSRKHRSPLITAIQQPARIPPEVRSVLFSNMYNWITFWQANQQDSNELKPHIEVGHNRLFELDAHECAAKIREEIGETYTGIMQPFDKPTSKRSVRDTEGL